MELARPVEDAFLAVFREAVSALEQYDVPYLLMGGMGSATHGRPRWTHDIDFFVHPRDAERTLEVLKEAGFRTEQSDPRWLFKAFKQEVMIDIIFKSSGNIYLDDEMLRRSGTYAVDGCDVRLIPPEDLLVIKAVASDEHTPRHWYDGLGIIAGAQLDWEYLVSRARRHGLRRVLSLLLYAQSCDLGVPQSVIRELYEAAFEQ